MSNRLKNGWSEYARDGVLSDGIVNIYWKDGRVLIEEDCDQWYFSEYTPEEAIQHLQEAIDWIKKGEQ